MTAAQRMEPLQPPRRGAALAAAVVQVDPALLRAPGGGSLRAAVHHAAASQRSVILDLGQVKTLDSLALLTLLACREAAALRGARIKLCALRPRARSVLLGARFHRLFEIFNTTEEARASFS